VNTDVGEDFEAWAQARAAGLARSALLLAGDVHLAEDLVQETLVRVAQHWSRLIRHGVPDAYAHRVLHNLATDAWRRRQRRPLEVDLADSRHSSAAEQGAGEVSSTDRRLLMREALDRLTPKQRAVLVLRYYEDFTEIQAAGVLGCSPNTVKSQTRQALSRLRQLAPDLLVEFEGRPEVATP
jgi:RNA polymerase sigma-70 factor (sigma-E family)